MKNYKASKKPILDVKEYFTEKEQYKLLSIFKEEFKNKNACVTDYAFYNFLREKPLFNGFEVIRTDKYWTFHYPSTYRLNVYSDGRHSWYEKLIKDFERLDYKNREEREQSKIRKVLSRIYKEISNNYEPEYK